MQDPTQAQALANASRVGELTSSRFQMPPLTPMTKKYAANVLQVARQRTEERIVKLADGRRVKIIRTYSLVR